MSNIKNKIEILSPAGSYEGMKAAINAGCNAVYLGGDSFGARAYANNFDEASLLKVIDEAHIKNTKVYLTINTLIKEEEMKKNLYKFLYRFYLNGLDAVIVQDMGVLHFIHRNFPDLPIHASTQSTLIMVQGVNILKEYGITRMVTARELSLEEIANIRKHTNLEIETFVHGALCYSYSGQCLMSSMIGGRSGNRGRCAQPCRMEYQLKNQGKMVSKNQKQYTLSPRDICTAEFIPEMIEAGIDSFKIEGRMKSPAYAASVTSFYRKYLELYDSIGKDQYKEIVNINNIEYQNDIMILEDIYNRGNFSKGYFREYSGKTMMSMDRPNHAGVLVGEVLNANDKFLDIKLSKDINPQDILEIRGQDIKYEFTVKEKILKSKVLKTKYLKDKNRKYQIGDKVYRTKNNMLIDSITEKFLLNDKKMSIKANFFARIGEPLKLEFIYEEKDISIVVYKEKVEKSLKQSITRDNIMKQLSKTGESYFTLEDIQISMDDHIFIPLSRLNEIRREAIALLESKITSRYYREEKDLKPIYEENIKDFNSEGCHIIALVQTLEQLNFVIQSNKVDEIYIDMDFIEFNDLESIFNDQFICDKAIYLALPRMIREFTYEYLLNYKEILLNPYINGYVIRNFEGIALAKEIQYKSNNKELILDSNMYVFNNEAKHFWKELGINRFTAPLELNYKELKQLSIRGNNILVYGNIPVMISTQCVYKNTINCMKHKNREEKRGYLIDKKDMNFMIQTNCRECYNIIYNSKVLSLINYVKEIENLNPRGIRLDFTIESEKEIQKIIHEYYNGFIARKTVNFMMEDYTTGHFKRGII